MFDSTSDEFEPVKISIEIEPVFDEEIPENSQEGVYFRIRK